MGAEARSWIRRGAAAAVLAAVASPLVLGDSFPLSTYPVYASARPDVEPLHTAVGIDAEGGRRRLGLRVIASTDDPLIAESLVARAIRAGDAAALCREIAARVPARIEAVEVVVERHDLVHRASGRRSLVERDVRARCRRPA